MSAHAAASPPPHPSIALQHAQLLTLPACAQPWQQCPSASAHAHDARADQLLDLAHDLRVAQVVLRSLRVLLQVLEHLRARSRALSLEHHDRLPLLGTAGSYCFAAT